MGKDKNKKLLQIKQLTRNGDQSNEKNISRKGSDESPSPFEMNGENAPLDYTSDNSIDNQRENILSTLFPWRSSNDSPDRRREEVQFRVASSSLLVHPTPASIFPLINALSIHRDNSDPSMPVIPHLLLAALTKGCANIANNKTPSFRFSELPAVIRQRIGSLAQAMHELRLVDRATLRAVTDDSESYLSLNELSTLARIRHLFLDCSKIRENRLFDSNWFFLEKGTSFTSPNLHLVQRSTMMGCSAGPDHFYARKPYSPVGETELIWIARLSQIGLPLWVYEIIRPQFTFKFEANYEPGDEFEVTIGLVARESHDEFVPVSPVRQNKTKIGPHAIQYEIILSDLPVPITDDSCPLDLFFRVCLPSQREDIIVYNLECRCNIVKGEEFANRVAEFDIYREQVHGLNGVSNDTPIEAAREPSLVKTMFPALEYNPRSSLVHNVSDNNHSAEKTQSAESKKPFLQGKQPTKKVAGRRK